MFLGWEGSILLSNFLLNPFLQNLNSSLSLLISVIFVSALLTHPVMPMLTGLFRFWLYPALSRPRWLYEAHKLGELLKLPLLLEACGADASGEQCQYGDRARHLHGFGRNRENELKLRLALVFPPADSANLHSSFWERFHLLHIEHQNWSLD